MPRRVAFDVTALFVCRVCLLSREPLGWADLAAWAVSSRSLPISPRAGDGKGYHRTREHVPLAPVALPPLAATSCAVCSSLEGLSLPAADACIYVFVRG